MSISRRDFVAAVAATGAAVTVGRMAMAEEEGTMDSAKPVYVIATVTVKEGKRDEFVKIFKDNVPAVHAEDGCILYEPVVDLDSGIGAQAPLRPNVMVVMEKWESLQHLIVHLDAPHMHTYRVAVKDLVEGVSLEVLEEA